MEGLVRSHRPNLRMRRVLSVLIEVPKVLEGSTVGNHQSSPYASRCPFLTTRLPPSGEQLQFCPFPSLQLDDKKED
jgi:hypothetical protein